MLLEHRPNQLAPVRKFMTGKDEIDPLLRSICSHDATKAHISLFSFLLEFVRGVCPTGGKLRRKQTLEKKEGDPRVEGQLHRR